MRDDDRTMADAPARVVPAGLHLRPALTALRARQWTKNLLVLAGIVFAAQVGEAELWLAASAAFAAYCAASSAAYILNDLRDAPHDRQHPVKRRRPIASGELSRRSALALAAALLVVAFGLAALLGPTAVGLMAAFTGVQTAYSCGLKRLPGLDAASIASLFVIRAAAGAEAIDVRISPWLLACTALLALFLAFAKRRGELLTSGVAGRPALARYSVAVLDPLIAAIAAATVVVYAVYALTVRTPVLAVTIPLVAFGLVRYAHLMRTRNVGEEPEHVLLTDVPIIVTVAAWVVACAAILLAA